MLALSLAVAFPTAAAAPDLSATWLAAPAVSVDQPGVYRVEVRNVGRHTASGATVSIALPATGTSPTVHVLGALSGVDPRCALAGTTLQCALGSLARNRSTTVSFTLAAPYSADPQEVVATADVAGDGVPGNDEDALAVAPAPYPVAFVAPQPVTIEMCSGTASLSSFYECELYPGSISATSAELLPGGAVDFGVPDLSEWTSSASTHLAIELWDAGAVVGWFEGHGSELGACWDGRTTFDPDYATNVAIWRVCLD